MWLVEKKIICDWRLPRWDEMGNNERCILMPSPLTVDPYRTPNQHHLELVLTQRVQSTSPPLPLEQRDDVHNIHICSQTPIRIPNQRTCCVDKGTSLSLTTLTNNSRHPFTAGQRTTVVNHFIQLHCKFNAYKYKTCYRKLIYRIHLKTTFHPILSKCFKVLQFKRY